MLFSTKISFRIVVFIFCFFTASINIYAQKTSAKQLLKDAKVLMSQSEYKEAIKQFQAYEQLVGTKKSKRNKVDELISTCENNNYLLLNKTTVKGIDTSYSSYSDLLLSYKNLSIKRLLLFIESDYQLKDHDVNTVSHHTQDNKGQILKKPNTDFFMSVYDAKHNDFSTVNITNDINQVYVSSYGDEQNSDRDIYLVKRLPQGFWSKPQGVSITINSESDENFPFYDIANNTFYFSSKGHNSMGGYDIFKTTYNTATETWSIPENMGVPINSIYDDIAFCPSTDGINTAYFASTRNQLPNNEVTVYNVKLPTPQEYTVVKGKIDSKKTLISVFDIDQKAFVGAFSPNTKKREYVIPLPKTSNQFIFQITSQSGDTQSQIVTIGEEMHKNSILKQSIKHDGLNEFYSLEFDDYPELYPYVSYDFESPDSATIQIKKAELASKKANLIALELNKVENEGANLENQAKLRALKNIKNEEAKLQKLRTLFIDKYHKRNNHAALLKRIQAIEKQLYELEQIDIDTMLFNHQERFVYIDHKKTALLTSLEQYKNKQTDVSEELNELNSTDNELNVKDKDKHRIALNAESDKLEYRIEFVKSELESLSDKLKLYKEEETLVNGLQSSLKSNNQLNEILMVSEKLAMQQDDSTADIHGLYYSVQVGVYDNNIPSNTFKNIEPLFKKGRNTNKTFRYTIGRYNNIKDAKAASSFLLQKGFEDSFIIALYNGKRISVAKAVNLESNNKSIVADSTIEYMNQMPYIQLE